MVTRMLRALLIMTVAICSYNAQALSQLTTSVDRNPAIVNESFVLTITADDNVSRNAVDFTPLMKQFAVGSPSVSNETQIFNGKTRQLTRWQIPLTATKPGQYTIPAFTIGKVHSSAITMQVVNTRKSNGNAAQHNTVFIETKVDDAHPYPKQQVILTVSLYIRSQMLSGSLSEPQIAGTALKQISKDRDQMTLVDGVRYREIQRQYALFPQSSGKLTIPPIKFEGSVLVRERRSLFDQDLARPIQALSEPITLNVRPIPANAPRPWLPARHISVQQSWQPAAKKIKLGTPITRSIELTAAGVDPDALPDLAGNYPDYVNVYPDKVNDKKGEVDGLLATIRSQSIALIPQHGGRLVIPDKTISWWDLDNDKPATVTLPGLTVDVEGQPATTSSTAPTQTNTPTATPPVSNTATTNPGPIRQVLMQSWLTWLFALFWLATAIAWFMHYRHYRRGHMPEAPKVQSENKKNHKNTSFNQACAGNDGRAIYHALDQLAQQRWPKLSSGQAMEHLLMTADRYQLPLRPLVLELQQHCYRDQQPHWQRGAELQQYVTQLLGKLDEQSSAERPLAAELYPR